MNVGEFATAVAAYLDGESSNRWTPRLILDAGGIVFVNEWSDILNQNATARFAVRTVVTDANGAVPLVDLDAGVGDTAELFYRVLGGFAAGGTTYTEATADMALGAMLSDDGASVAPGFFLAGESFQILPRTPGLTLRVPVNHMPVSIALLSTDLSAIVFPRGYEYILVWVTAATLLLKGGAESQAASDLISLADGARKNMLGDVGRRSTRPTFARFSDAPEAWAG